MANFEKDDDNRLDYALALQIGVTTPFMMRMNAKNRKETKLVKTIYTEI